MLTLPAAAAVSDACVTLDAPEIVLSVVPVAVPVSPYWETLEAPAMATEPAPELLLAACDAEEETAIDMVPVPAALSPA